MYILYILCVYYLEIYIIYIITFSTHINSYFILYILCVYYLEIYIIYIITFSTHINSYFILYMRKPLFVDFSRNILTPVSTRTPCSCNSPKTASAVPLPRWGRQRNGQLTDKPKCNDSANVSNWGLANCLTEPSSIFLGGYSSVTPFGRATFPPLAASHGKAFAVAFLYRYNRKHIDIYKF